PSRFPAPPTSVCSTPRSMWRPPGRRISRERTFHPRHGQNRAPYAYQRRSRRPTSPTMRSLLLSALALVLLSACSTDVPEPESGDPDAPALTTAQELDAPAAPNDSTRQTFDALIAYAEAENLAV